MKESADVGNYAVLFIDILGQSEKIKEYTLVPEEKTEYFN